MYLHRIQHFSLFEIKNRMDTRKRTHFSLPIIHSSYL